MSLHLDELFRKKFQKVPHLVEKHEKPSIWPKLAIFRANYDVLAFSWTFQKEVAKSASFREKAREIIDFAKTCNFSKKLPCFYVSMNFMAETCKKCLISWKSTKTHRFDKNYATFSNKLPCFGVSINFSAKGCKMLLNSWKSTKSHPFGQNFATFRNKLPCLFISMNLSGKICKKCLISWKSTKNHRFGQNFQLFEQTTMLFLAFSWTFQQKVAESASFGEKAREIIDLAETIQLF